MAKPADRPIAVAFFSITRSLRHTYPSIKSMALTPASQFGPVGVHAHFWHQRQIDNPRSEERGELDAEEYKLLEADHLQLEPPLAADDIEGSVPFETLKGFGDTWNDDFRSLGNLYKQLVSLERVTESVLNSEAEICLFLRPDLTYHDSLKPIFRKALKAKSPTVLLPWWQSWHGGRNDRFALCVGRPAIAAYGQRLSQAAAFCQSEATSLHSERLVRFALESDPQIRVQRFGARATRTRVGGALHPKEVFTHPLQDKALYHLRRAKLIKTKA